MHRRIGQAVLAAALAASALLVPAASSQARESTSTRTGTSSHPLYWIAYEQPFTSDSPLTESQWDADISWVSHNLKPYGYTMASTDGWIEGGTQTDAHGYVLKYNDSWTKTWSGVKNQLDAAGLDMGVYYNPLWVTPAAVADPAKTVVGRPDLKVSDIVNPGDRFLGNPDKPLYWADVTKPGTKEYVQGYVNYFKNIGVKFLRIDFLSWYESATAVGAPAGSVAHGADNYATALRWIEEAAGPDLEVSLVMPNLYDHAATEVKYGDLMRIDEDVFGGGWDHVSGRRQTWQPGWSQWANQFLGFTGFSDVGGRGAMTLDGDFTRLSTFPDTPIGDAGKRTEISLLTMAGAPIAVADTNTTGDGQLAYYQNREILALKQEGFTGKPVYRNADPYEPATAGQEATGSRDTERWMGQTADGDWVVALFNRDDTRTRTLSLDLSAEAGLADGGDARDLWTHTDLGHLTSVTATLAPHDVKLVRIKPTKPAADAFTTTYQAEVATWRDGAKFDNNHAGYSGTGFVDKLEAASAGSNVVFAVDAPKAGSYDLGIRYAAGSGASTVHWSAQNLAGAQQSAGTASLPGTADWNTWSTGHQQVTLAQGVNLLTVHRDAADTGAINLDSITLDNRNPVANGGFESGDLSGWSEWHDSGPQYGVDSYDVADGQYKLYFYDPAQPVRQSAHQTLSLPAGTYTVRAKAKLQSLAGNPVTTARLELTPGGAPTTTSPITLGAAYQDVTGTVTLDAAGTLDLGFYLDAGPGTSLQLDDVTVTRG
ncbi:carbohydrate-binding protein [Kitasatospora sp. NRRL B-11411]|uniref:carbohydrate-binding protein n=1 Tax=Kitasatospora sp. NRRL B-11411 TaxID=1463822 RepID=UPI0012FF26C4|nr:carbohydrate-binding protein [Kitasatospora sp. NRRL B-11411]